MFRNYLTIAWRNLLKNKVFSFINVGGLAVGIAAAMLIGLWIYDELSYNKYHKNYDRVAWVLQNQTFNGKVETWYGQALQLGPELRKNYGSNFKHVVMTSGPSDITLSYEDKHLAKKGRFMEPAITKLLTLNMLQGSANGLQDPHSIILSATAAKALFGNDDPIDKIISINNREDVKVTGVYEDIPPNSDFNELEVIAPWNLLVSMDNLANRVGWGNSWFGTLVQLADNADMATVSEKIKPAKRNRLDNEEALKFNPALFLHPMERWRLYSKFEDGVSTASRIRYIWLFGIIGVFILLLACINFMNLSTARSEKRAREVGIRKTIGSLRQQLIGQFFLESWLITALAFIVSVFLVYLLLPFFNDVADKKITIPWFNPFFWISGAGIIFVTAIIAGSYPALYLSSFKPVKILKGTFRTGRLSAIPRKALVVLQFTVSVALIIGTIVVYRQVQLANDRPIGYSRNGLVTAPIKTKEIKEHFESIKNELQASGVVEAVALSESSVVNSYTTNSGFQWKGKDPSMQDIITTVGVTTEYGKTVNWHIKEGRDFSPAIASDSFGFILNETAVKYMALENPIGERVKAFGNTYTVIGVVKDMVMQSPYEPVTQTIFYVDRYNRTKLINLKIAAQVSAGKALEKIEAVYKKYAPSTPFEYRFADDEFSAVLKEEKQAGKLAAAFSTLAIFISCLGLFGMASFIAEQRTKEIGVRKVLGASVFSVWRLLSKDFVLLVLISLLIAIPVAYWGMQSWLQNYTFRTNLSWWIFAAAAGSAVLITILTVSFQAIKAALVNPVAALRSE